jgi:hypothetical protein
VASASARRPAASGIGETLHPAKIRMLGRECESGNGLWECQSFFIKLIKMIDTESFLVSCVGRLWFRKSCVGDCGKR